MTDSKAAAAASGGDSNQGLSHFVDLVEKLGREKNVLVHVLSSGADITVPKAKKLGEDGDQTTSEGVLLEGQDALKYFMDPDKSDCLLVVNGSRQIHARKGMYRPRHHDSPGLLQASPLFLLLR